MPAGIHANPFTPKSFLFFFLNLHYRSNRARTPTNTHTYQDKTYSLVEAVQSLQTSNLTLQIPSSFSSGLLKLYLQNKPLAALHCLQRKQKHWGVSHKTKLWWISHNWNRLHRQEWTEYWDFKPLFNRAIQDKIVSPQEEWVFPVLPDFLRLVVGSSQ